MRAGVIDIGSDSIKLVIGEGINEETTILETLRNVLPLGKSTFLKGRISQETINRTINILEKYKKTLEEYNVTNYKVIATTAIREASNKDIFVDTVARKTGIHIEVLNVGDVVFYIDAFLSYRLEKKYPIHEKNLLIAELGGGSLDVSVMRRGFTLTNVGISLGTLRLRQLMNKFGGSFEENLEALREYVENDFRHLKSNLPRIQIDDIILIDENYFYFQNFLPDKTVKSNFFQFTQKESETILTQLSEKNIEEISREYKIPLEIAESIYGYAVILNNLFSFTENRYIYILETSLSEAILENLLFDLELSKKYNRENQLVSVAKALCYKYGLDLSHAKQVAHLAKVLFASLADALGLRPEDSLYLLLAAYLHDIGSFINNRSHHKHTEYIINSSNLFRLSDEEVRLIACIARYHRRATPGRTHVGYNSLSLEKQILVQKLSAILRIANSLDRSHKQKIKGLDVHLNQSQDVTIVVEAQGNVLLERADFLEKKNLYEEITGNKINLVVKE